MEAIGDAIYADFGGKYYRIIAELTDVKIYYQRSYAFMTLVEKKDGEISASAGGVIWRDHFDIIKSFEKATGVSINQNLELAMEVEVQFHPRYGLRLSIVSIDEKYTLGKLEQDKQKTLDKLVKENPKIIWLRDGEYRSNNQFIKLQMVMQKIALISAAGSDGRRDFLHELENNAYGLDYSLAEFPAQVQGEYAAKQIAERLGQIQQWESKFDLIALVRGGGGSTDFSAFDSYEVGLGIASSKIPVFTGIGHERNVSIADMVAHTAQKTPTKCAAAVTEHNLEFLAFVQNVGSEIGKHAHRMTEQFRQKTKTLENDILKSFHWKITGEKQWMENSLERLSMADPNNTLKRGFTLVYQNQKHISKGENLRTGDKIEVRFSDKIIEARVE